MPNPYAQVQLDPSATPAPLQYEQSANYDPTYFKGQRKNTGKPLSMDQYNKLRGNGDTIYEEELPKDEGPSRDPSSIGSYAQELMGYMKPKPAPKSYLADAQDRADLDAATNGVTSKFVNNAFPKQALVKPSTTPTQEPQRAPDSALPPSAEGTMTSDNPMLDDAAEVKASGLFGGRDGSKYNESDKSGGTTTDKTGKVITPEAFSQVEDALHSSPEWQEQAQGLKDLENAVKLKSWRNQRRFDPDLSGAGALGDFLNAQRGIHTNMSEDLKAHPPEDTSVSDLGDVQRRKNDLSKDLINLVRFGKYGDMANSMNWGNTNGFQIGGMNPMAAANHDDKQFQNFYSASTKILEPTDKTKAAIDQLTSLLHQNNPADVNRIPILRLKGDTGSARQAVQEVMMERYGQSIPDKIQRQLNTWMDGTVDMKDLGDLNQSMKDSIKRWTDERANQAGRIQALSRAYGVTPDRVRSAFPDDYLLNGYTKPAPANASLPKDKGSQSPAPQAGALPEGDLRGNPEYEAFKKAHGG